MNSSMPGSYVQGKVGGATKEVYPQVFGRSSQLSQNKFFDLSTPVRKVDDGEKKRKKKIIISYIVATNVIASRPPERRPTGTPLAHVKIRERGANLPTLFLSISHGQMAHPMGLKIFFFSYLSGIPPIWPLQGGTSQLITTHDSL